MLFQSAEKGDELPTLNVRYWPISACREGLVIGQKQPFALAFYFYPNAREPQSVDADVELTDVLTQDYPTCKSAQLQ